MALYRAVEGTFKRCCCCCWSADGGPAPHHPPPQLWGKFLGTSLPRDKTIVPLLCLLLFPQHSKSLWLDVIVKILARRWLQQQKQHKTNSTKCSFCLEEPLPLGGRPFQSSTPDPTQAARNRPTFTIGKLLYCSYSIKHGALTSIRRAPNLLRLGRNMKPKLKWEMDDDDDEARQKDFSLSMRWWTTTSAFFHPLVQRGGLDGTSTTLISKCCFLKWNEADEGK